MPILGNFFQLVKARKIIKQKLLKTSRFNCTILKVGGEKFQNFLLMLAFITILAISFACLKGLVAPGKSFERIL